jgi:hypothetical protein
MLVACSAPSSSPEDDQDAQANAAAAAINDVRTDTSLGLLRNEELLPNEEVAIAVAEPILFNIYGKERIMEERPYKTIRSGEHWVIEGHLDDDMLGGVFEIILSSKDGRVMKISHGK